MPQPVVALDAMIAGMVPVLAEGRWAFCTMGEAQATALLPQAIAMFREAEGPSLILPVALAPPGAVPMRQITLTVYSSLEGVGLTAAVSSALAAAGIPCNMVAAFCHDHVFVPEVQAQTALALLLAMQASRNEPT